MANDLLRQAAQAFGNPPREFSFWDRLTYLRIPKPGWIKYSPRDELRNLFRHRKALLADGVVVWGAIVQANSLMFKRGSSDSPADVVFSLTDAQRVDPGYLLQIARQLFALKGTKPAGPGLAAIAQHLTNERTRVFGLPVPASISPKANCQISTTLLVRKHLPRHRLAGSYFPLLVSKPEPRVVLPLPARYWPPELIEQWSAKR
jgi:hypothetical protein